MLKLTDKNITGKVLDHLGIVSATIDNIGLISKVDARLPLSLNKGVKTTIGQRVSAMILNGLGFINTRLYMFPEFLENKPVGRLIGKNLVAEDFNDDALGRALDSIHEYGTNKLFTEIAFEIGAEQGLLGKTIHVDSTSLSVHGEYKEEAEVVTNPEVITEDSELIATPQITYGHSKDHRPDLKQVILNLATTGAAGFPIMMETHSGNASDQKILHEAVCRMKKFCKKLNGLPEFMYVGDSAMYNSCVNNNEDFIWLSRVPESINEAKALLQKEDKVFSWQDLGNGYRICPIDSNYKDVKQRWCVVSSEQAYTREIITLEKNIIKENERANQILKNISRQQFACKTDALEALHILTKKIKYHKFVAHPVEVRKHPKNGRPKKGVLGSVIGYKLQGAVEEDSIKIAISKLTKGRFILATNQLDIKLLPTETILSEYKEQSKTESGFKFIKDNSFEVSSIFLKKAERISALMMIMTLCLMVYCIAQHTLRTSLQTLDKDVLNQNGSPTQKPTMKRVFKLFHGVQVLTIVINGDVQELVINLNAQLKDILHFFGSKALEIYDLTEQTRVIQNGN